MENSVKHDPDCIFCKIIEGRIPSKKVYEDEDVLAFHDINPAAPIHFLIIPKTHISMLVDATDENQQILGKIMVLAPKLALEVGARPGKSGGFKVLVNNGADGGQEVYHLHLHVLAGPRPWKHELPG
jgi:histidine triad (HIT) family protein